MILEDFVMLGKTVPEPSSDGRVFVCSAGVSAEYRRLVRIYPLARRSAPPRWSVSRVPLERNPKDSRIESFKLAGDRAIGAHDQINERFEVAGKVTPRERIKLLSPYAINSIAEANAKRMSLAIVHPDAFDLTFDHNPSSPDSPQMALFDDGIEKPTAGARRFPFIPRLRFRDECGWHALMLRDWGCYEFMRKNEEPYYRQNMAKALHLDPDSSLLIGNLNNQRTAWLVISVLNGLREAATLFDAIADERPAMSEKVRRQVYERDGWACRLCSSTDGLVVDHKWPYSRGGTNALENLQTLCADCNQRKSDQIAEAV
jgi:hypothetical protein